MRFIWNGWIVPFVDGYVVLWLSSSMYFVALQGFVILCYDIHESPYCIAKLMHGYVALWLR